MRSTWALAIDIMQAAELRNQEDAELKRQMQAAREEMFNLRFQLAAGKGANTSRFTKLRRDIARIQTILRERQEA